jgi:hypothetical protein
VDNVWEGPYRGQIPAGAETTLAEPHCTDCWTSSSSGRLSKARQLYCGVAKHALVREDGLVVVLTAPSSAFVIVMLRRTPIQPAELLTRRSLWSHPFRQPDFGWSRVAVVPALVEHQR